MFKTIIVNVDELWLKGRNKSDYLKLLRLHIKEIIKKMNLQGIVKKEDRAKFIYKCKDGFSDEFIQRLSYVPGIYSIVPSYELETNYDELKRFILTRLSKDNFTHQSFKIESKRIFKNFPIKSMDIIREIGILACAANETLTVDLKKPDLKINIRIYQNKIFVSDFKVFGVGGLPVGTSGHMMTLLSGGFDSPVASYLMSKRGVKQSFIFFHAYPYVGDEVLDKIYSLTESLARYQKHTNLHIVSFGNIQKIITENCYPEYRTLIFRWYMLKITEKIAAKYHANGVITGDALSQVSSQTLSNITVLEKSIDLPIFRPLIGFNKSEIIELSRKIETHDISIIPHDDACSMLAPRSPILNSKAEVLNQSIDKIDKLIDIDSTVSSLRSYGVTVLGEMYKNYGNAN